MKITKGVKALVNEAEAQIETLTPLQVEERLGRPGVMMVDLRDIRELKREGRFRGPSMCLAACWNSGLIRKAPITNPDSMMPKR